MNVSGKVGVDVLMINTALYSDVCSIRNTSFTRTLRSLLVYVTIFKKKLRPWKLSTAPVIGSFFFSNSMGSDLSLLGFRSEWFICKGKRKGIKLPGKIGAELAPGYLLDDDGDAGESDSSNRQGYVLTGTELEVFSNRVMNYTSNHKFSV